MVRSQVDPFRTQFFASGAPTAATQLLDLQTNGVEAGFERADLQRIFPGEFIPFGGPVCLINREGEFSQPARPCRS